MAFRAAGAGMSYAAVEGGGVLDQTSGAERAAQSAALASTLSVLLSAGYFRARLAQLPPFDKLVGGLCWCISSSGTAVDVDLFYDDELGLGQKIQLCEVIVKVLRSMSCPHPLQAHQIQGNDYVACFPVVQWLVKTVLEYRAITGDYVRTASQSAFYRTFSPWLTREDAASAQASSRLLMAGADRTLTSATMPQEKLVDHATDRYQAVRKFRRQAAAWTQPMTSELRVQSVLLEFGERVTLRTGASSASTASASGSDDKRAGRSAAADFDRKFAALQRAAKAEAEEKAKAAAENERNLLAQMTDAKAGVSGSNVSAFMGLRSEEMRRAAEAYRQKEEELRALAESGDLLANTKMGRAAAHARRVAALKEKLDAAEKAKAERAAEVAAVEVEVEARASALAKVEKYNLRAVTGIAKLDADIEALPAEDKARLKQLFDLLSRSESLADQADKFKTSCREEMQRLQAHLASLQAEGGSSDAAVRLAQLAATHTEATDRYNRARAVVAEKTREIARLARLIDDVPSQAELIQYKRRFTELYEEVGEKLDETRKYYSTYNMLVRKRDFLTKEEELISSLHTNFSALKSKAQRQTYLEQCDAIMATVESTLAKQVSMLDGRKSVRDMKAVELQRLVETQRAYYKAVKEFQDQCDYNDKLQAMAQAQQRAVAEADAGTA